MYVSWQMTAVGITENVKGDVKKFEIWYSGREEVYVVQVRSRTKFKYTTLLMIYLFLTAVIETLSARPTMISRQKMIC